MIKLLVQLELIKINKFVIIIFYIKKKKNKIFSLKLVVWHLTIKQIDNHWRIDLFQKDKIKLLFRGETFSSLEIPNKYYWKNG